MGGRVLSDNDRNAVLTNLFGAGIFVTCGRKTPNVMIAHTGTAGKLWGHDVFILPVKSSKYSYRIVSETKSFALNAPLRDMRDEIARCDVISGFTHNKIEELGLHVKRARSIDAYVLGKNALIVECKTIAVIPPESVRPELDGLITDRSHTLFVGEPIESYRV